MKKGGSCIESDGLMIFSAAGREVGLKLRTEKTILKLQMMVSFPPGSYENGL